MGKRPRLNFYIYPANSRLISVYFVVSPSRRHLIRYLPKMSKHNHLFAYTGFQCKITLSKCHKDNGHTIFFFKFQKFCKYFKLVRYSPCHTILEVKFHWKLRGCFYLAVRYSCNPRSPDRMGGCYVLAFNVHPTVRHFISQNDSFWRH